MEREQSYRTNRIRRGTRGETRRGWRRATVITFILGMSLAFGLGYRTAPRTANVQDNGWFDAAPLAALQGAKAEGDEVDFAPLRQQVADYVGKQSAAYRVYFQDLTSGKDFGIGEHDATTAASTTKLPTVLYLYTLAAQGKIDLKEKVAYRPSDYQDGSGVLAFNVRPGDEYSLQTLANLAITLSDNIANQMLLRRLGKGQVSAFMRSLGAKVVNPGGQNMTTAADLAIYLHAVLDLQRKYPAWGGRLLDEMEHTAWNSGLNAKLPDEVPVAHKYGATPDVANDYGLIFGSRPYLLVVLSSKQDSVDAGFGRIAEIGKMVYDYEQKVAAADRS